MPRIAAAPLNIFKEKLNVSQDTWQKVLGEHKLPHNIRFDSHTKIPLSAFVGITDHICGQASENLAAWKLGEDFELTYLGDLGFGIENAPTLGDALKAFEVGFCTLQSDTQAKFIIEDDIVTFEYRILDHNIWPRRNDAKLTLGLISGIIKRYCGNNWRPLGLQFEHTQGQEAKKLMAYTQSNAMYEGDSNKISFPVSLLSSKLPKKPDNSYKEALDMLVEKVRVFEQERKVSQRIKFKIMENLGAGKFDQTKIAASLGMSRRTLRRRLEEEDLTFQTIVDECRKKSAYASLTRTSMPLCDIALSLGYSDQTAFSRAFTRWFGVSPRALRKDSVNNPFSEIIKI